MPKISLSQYPHYYNSRCYLWNSELDRRQLCCHLFQPLSLAESGFVYCNGYSIIDKLFFLPHCSHHILIVKELSRLENFFDIHDISKNDIIFPLSIIKGIFWQNFVDFLMNIL